MYIRFLYIHIYNLHLIYLLTSISILYLYPSTGNDISGRHCHVIGCSGVTGEGLKDGFDWIVDDISSRVFIMS